jgi:preprotein translocase subunit Sss1
MTQQLTNHASLWVERLGRFGYVSKGVVYGIVGLLAAQAAFGNGGKTTDTQGALQTIVNQPFGKFLLALVAIGLIGYVIWRFVQAIKDPENKGNDAKGLAVRIGYAVNGLIYASLALSAVKIVMGTGGGKNSSDSTEDSTARLLSQPFGQWLVGTAGAFVIALGFYQFYQAFSGKFRKELNLTELSNTEAQWVMRIARFGLAARGIVFCITGWFLIEAARQSNAATAVGLDEVLQTLAQQPYGAWLLGIVALGLVAYAIYTIIQARYRRLVNF